MSDHASERVQPALSRTHANDVVHGYGPDLAVTDSTGPSALDQDVDDVFGILVVHEHLKPHFRDQIHGVLSTPVDLGVAPLTAEALGFADRHPLDPEGLEGRLHFVEHVGLDDRSHELHAVTSWSLLTTSSSSIRCPPPNVAPRPIEPSGLRSYPVSA